jgi:hypothetical protein
LPLLLLLPPAAFCLRMSSPNTDISRHGALCQYDSFKAQILLEYIKPNAGTMTASATQPKAASNTWGHVIHGSKHRSIPFC